TTKRGLDGQFLKGYSTGGRTYGFSSEPVLDESAATDHRGDPNSIGYRITVVPEEADVVREIFRLFRTGHGEKSIAKLLNASRPGRNWRPNTIYLMLQNPKYVGRFYFIADSGRRTLRPAVESLAGALPSSGNGSPEKICASWMTTPGKPSSGGSRHADIFFLAAAQPRSTFSQGFFSAISAVGACPSSPRTTTRAATTWNPARAQMICASVARRLRS